MRDIFEIIYFISGPLLVITSGFIFWQIKIAQRNLMANYTLIELEKKELRLKAKRESIEISCNQISNYLDEIVPLYWEVKDYIISMYGDNIEIKTFTIKDLGPKDLTRKSLEATILHLENGLDLMRKNPEKSLKVSILMNKLETFSIYFTNGIADESIAFVSISISFCEIFEVLYAPICLYREENKEIGYFNNLIELYKLWKDRIKVVDRSTIRESLEKKVLELNNLIKEVKQHGDISKTKKIKPLGTEDD